MSRDPGDIPLRGSGRANPVETLSIAQDLPAEALDIAVAQPGRVVPPVLAVLERAAAGADLADRDVNLLFWGIHVLGAVREQRLLPPLLGLMRLPADRLAEWLGDTLTDTFPRMVIGSYGGDWAALSAAILDPRLDGYARSGLFLASAYLAASGAAEHDRVVELLEHFAAARPVGGSDVGWYGWEGAIALLGLDALVPQVDAARADGRLLEDVSDPADFAAILDEARRAAPGDLSRFEASGLSPIGDVVAELEDMLAEGDDETIETPEPVRNELRSVGRNDPCPCGSGKKFKKCCLESA